MVALSNFWRLTQSTYNDNQPASLQMLEPFDKAEKVCTLTVYFRAFDDFPLIIAANRDEHYDRPSAPPSLLQTTPKIISGRALHEQVHTQRAARMGAWQQRRVVV